MSLAVPLMLLLLLASSNKTEKQELKVKDVNTDLDLLCADPIVVMNFSSMRLGRIGENFLTSPIVTCLDLKANGIEELEAHTFDNIPNLKYLQMSFNSFNPNNVFESRLDNVEVLLLDELYSSSQVSISGTFPKLRKLFLRNSGIEQLLVASQDVFPSLTHLYLSDNSFDEDNFDWLPQSLEYLDLTSHDLSTLTLTNLNNLKRIFVDNSRNSLHTLNFQNLSNLEYLSASSNLISEISSETFLNLNSLLYLDLSDNYINYIEVGSFDSMKKLKFLNLSSNNLEIIQGGLFEKLSDLKVLILEKNSITAFPIIGTPTKLESISLNCNRMKAIIGGNFIKMPQLNTLLLHDNEITNIDQEAFIGLEKLKVLTLSDNKLSALPQYWMEPLISLEELDLTGNQIVSFGNLALSKSFTLKNIYLSNQVLFIETGSLVDLPVNATISVDPSFEFIEKCRRTYIDRRTPYYR